jgi:hypothetical protein
MGGGMPGMIINLWTIKNRFTINETDFLFYLCSTPF